VKKLSALAIAVYILLMTFAGCGGKHLSMLDAEIMEGKCLSKPLTRNRYFAGQVLTADDLQNEQSYLQEKHRLHNRFLHGTGVVCGLVVKAVPGTNMSVTVSPGFAIDSTGWEILVPKSQTISLDDYSGDVYLTVCYKETFTGSSPVPGQNQGVEYSKVIESFKFEALMALPEGYVSTYDILKNSDDEDTLMRIFQNHLNCCAGDEDMPIILAKIHIRRSGQLEDKDIDNVRFRKLILNSADIALSLVDD
jgi:hypothetical protein